jgi:hypothetical protein
MTAPKYAPPRTGRSGRSVGQLVTVTGTATGFVRPQYKLWAIGPHNGGPVTWLSLGAYSENRAVTWTPNAPGSYQLQMWCREVGSTAQKEAAATVGYLVQALGAVEPPCP